jgi:hypothetical protein
MKKHHSKIIEHRHSLSAALRYQFRSRNDLNKAQRDAIEINEMQRDREINKS